MRIPFLSLILGFLLLIIVAFLVIRASLFNATVAETGRLQTASVSAQTHLDRSADGHVMVTASTMRNTMAGIGFAHARDRLWQMQRFHWAVHSRYSSLFGTEYILADKLSAAILYSSNGDLKEALGITSYDYELLGYYADGINDFIIKSGRDYSIQFTVTGTRPSLWTADDVLRIFVLQNWLLHTDWQQELANTLVSASLPASLLPYMFGEDSMEIIRKLELPNELFPQVRTLLKADNQLRQLLNAPGHIGPVRSVSQVSTDGSIVHFTSLQSGNQAPTFWYDVSISNPDEDSVTGFTIPGTPVLWAGSGPDRSWVPETDFATTDIVLPADSIQNRAHIIVETDEGEQHLFRLPHNESGFLPQEYENPAFLFNRLNQNLGINLSAFREMAFNGNHPKPETSGLGPFLIIPDGQDSSITTGFSFEIADYLNERSLFNHEQLLTLNESQAHDTHPGRIELAAQLSDILGELDAIPDINITRQYLTNWNGQYERYAVAASIMELSLRKIGENALRSYLEEEDYELLEGLGLIDQEIGTQLIRAHYRAMQQSSGGVSPVSNAFFARRLQEALAELRTFAGEETFDWRWGNVNKNTFTDRLICGYADDTNTYRSRSRACVRLETAQNIPVLGQQDLLNAVRIYSDGKSIRTQTLTTAVIQTIRRPGRASETVTVLIPGTSSNPFTKFYNNGLDSWPPFGPIARTSYTVSHTRFTLTP